MLVCSVACQNLIYIVIADARMKRGMSKAGPNFPIIDLARRLVLDDLESPDDEDVPQFFADTPINSFILPDITIYPEDFKAFLYNDLIDNYTLVSLEQAGL